MAAQIYPKYNVIYYGLVKNAQTMMFNALGINWIDRSNKREGVLGLPLCVKDYASEERLSWYIPRYPNYFTCVTVRNPWDRLLSFFYYISQHTQEIRNLYNWDFKKYVHAMEDWWKSKWGPDGRLGQKNEYPTFPKQSSWIDIDLKKIGFILHFENLHNDFDLLCIKLGVRDKYTEENHPLNRDEYRNKSRRGSEYQDYYDQETRELVGEIFRDDIQKFEYEF